MPAPNQLSSDEISLIKSLQRSTEQMLSMYELVKVPPKMKDIKNILDYVTNLQNLICEFLKIIPKTCVPMQIHKMAEKDCKTMEDNVKQLVKEKRECTVEISVLETKLRESDQRYDSLLTQKNDLLLNNRVIRTKVNNIKRNSEDSIKKIFEVASSSERKLSLPALPQKEKLGLLWMLGMSNTSRMRDSNERLVNHLLHK